MNTEIPAEDAAFLKEVIDGARALYASAGRMQPSAIIRTAPGMLPGSPNNTLLLAIPQIGGDQAAKLDAMDIIRHHSIRLGSPRSAILAESWSIKANENTQRELALLRSQGKRMGDHPDAFEIVMVTIESDNGQIQASLSIDRRHASMTVLEPRDEVTFIPRGTGPSQPMLLTDFHVPMAERLSPETIAWAKQMDVTRGDPRDRTKAKAKAEAKADAPIPETTRH